MNDITFSVKRKVIFTIYIYVRYQSSGNRKGRKWIESIFSSLRIQKVHTSRQWYAIRLRQHPYLIICFTCHKCKKVFIQFEIEISRKPLNGGNVTQVTLNTSKTTDIGMGGAYTHLTYHLAKVSEILLLDRKIPFIF